MANCQAMCSLNAELWKLDAEAENHTLHIFKSYDWGGDEAFWWIFYFFFVNLNAYPTTTTASRLPIFIRKSPKFPLHLFVITTSISTALQVLTGEAEEMSRKAESLTKSQVVHPINK